MPDPLLSFPTLTLSGIHCVLDRQNSGHSDGSWAALDCPEMSTRGLGVLYPDLELGGPISLQIVVRGRCAIAERAIQAGSELSAARCRRPRPPTALKHQRRA